MEVAKVATPPAAVTVPMVVMPSLKVTVPVAVVSGATVDVVEAYRTVAPPDLAARVKEVLARKPHWITFTSSSTVNNFVTAVGSEVLDGIRVASIGPITSATVREHGLKLEVEAQPHTVAGLVEAISSASIAKTWR